MSEAPRPAIDRVEFDGEYDLTRREEVRAALSPLDGTRPVVLDVRRITYVDSSFFNELANFRRDHKECAVTIEGPSSMMKRLLKMLAFDKLFTITNGD